MNEEFVRQLIEKLGLKPLVGEGGLFRQTYLSAESLEKAVLPTRYAQAHPVATAIYFLLTDDPDSFSALHRLPTDEIYHFYLGDPVGLLLLHPDGRAEEVTMGQDLLGGQEVQFVAPAHAWQGSRLLAGGRFALLGTTMAPGYIQEDFEIGRREELVAAFPQFVAQIERLCRE